MSSVDYKRKMAVLSAVPFDGYVFLAPGVFLWDFVGRKEGQWTEMEFKP